MARKAEEEQAARRQRLRRGANRLEDAAARRLGGEQLGRLQLLRGGERRHVVGVELARHQVAAPAGVMPGIDRVESEMQRQALARSPRLRGLRLPGFRSGGFRCRGFGFRHDAPLRVRWCLGDPHQAATRRCGAAQPVRLLGNPGSNPARVVQNTPVNGRTLSRISLPSKSNGTGLHGYFGSTAILIVVTGAPFWRNRAAPCQLFFSLMTLKTSTFRPLTRVTSPLSVSFSRVRVSANFTTGLPFSHTLHWSFEPIDSRARISVSAST